MASLFTRTYTFVDGTTAYGSQVEAEIANIVTVLNSLNAATTSWGLVSISNAVSVPLVADCAAGSQHIADFKNNSVIKASVASDGTLTTLASVIGPTLTAGASGTTGTVEVYPTTASKGKVTLTTAANTGNTTTNLNVAAQGGARTYTVPDMGASSTVMLSSTALVDNARVNAAGYIIGTVVQTVQATDTTNITSVGTAFTSTSTAASITPKATTHKIRISVTGSLYATGAATVSAASIFRGASDLSGGAGFTSVNNASGAGRAPCAMVYEDSPATTSATTYTVKIKSTSAASAQWDVDASTNVILLEEIAI